ncbi:restriction endonuclease [bacterium]|nr:restriction endonuclease [bacterium]
MNNKKKGNLLEEAVELIEKQIIKVHKIAKEDEVIIERNKIFNIDGAKYEIDVFVKINKAQGYSSIFIFECKNWDSAKVGRKEITDFSEKINITQAQRGFFVAIDFTKDAINRAKKDEKLELLKASKFDINFSDALNSLVVEDRKKRTIKRFGFDEERENINDEKEDEIIPRSEFTINFNHLEKEYEEFHDLVSNMCLTSFLADNKFKKPGGYHIPINKLISFEHENLIVCGKRMKFLTIIADYYVIVGKPIVHKVFNIEGRGTHINLEYEFPNGKTFKLSHIGAVLKNENK